MHSVCLAASDVLCAYFALDRDPLGGRGVGFGYSHQRFSELQADERTRGPMVDVDAEVERFAKQRLQLRHVEHGRLAVGDSAIHRNEAYAAIAAAAALGLSRRAYSGHQTPTSLEIYSRLAITDAQREFAIPLCRISARTLYRPPEWRACSSLVALLLSVQRAIAFPARGQLLWRRFFSSRRVSLPQEPVPSPASLGCQEFVAPLGLFRQSP